jgi:hypothetical protein
LEVFDDMQSANEIIKAYKNLPKGERAKIREFLNEDEQQEKVKREEVQEQIRKYKLAQKWIDENGEKYLNQWVCLDGDKLIAHSKDGKDLYQKAKEAGIKIPFIKRIIKEPEAFVGGWT